MAQQRRFKIPTSLDSSYMDLEFTFRTSSGLSTNKPITAKTLLLSLTSLLLWFYLIMNSFLKAGGFLIIFLFSLCWLIMTVLLVKSDTTNKTGLELLPSMLNYIQKQNRRVSVRSLDKIGPLRLLMGIRDVDEEDGMIYFLDGTIGYVYQVVGSASILMFDEDKQAILERVDGFYRKLPVNVEILYDTVTESQKTYEQVEHLQKRYKKFQENSHKVSPGLQHMYEEQYAVLRFGVGERYKSLHQYLIVKAGSQDLLDEFESVLQGEYENSGLMFKYVKALSYDETEQYFNGMFSGLPRDVFAELDGDE